MLDLKQLETALIFAVAVVVIIIIVLVRVRAFTSRAAAWREQNKDDSKQE